MRIDKIIEQKTFLMKNEHYTVFEKVDGSFLIDHSRHGRFILDKEDFQEFIQMNPTDEAQPTPIILTPIYQ